MNVITFDPHEGSRGEADKTMMMLKEALSAPPGGQNMTLRKVLQLAQTLAITLPRPYCEAIGLKKGGYVEVYLKDGKTIIIKNHGKEPKGITIHD